jgi:hypothetical protein
MQLQPARRACICACNYNQLAAHATATSSHTAAELATLKATTKTQDAKIKALSALSAQLRAKRGAPVEKKPIPVCTVCSKRGHDAVDFWDKLDADQAKLDVAKANRDKKKADMAKRQPSSKETKAYTAAVSEFRIQGQELCGLVL